MAKSSKKPLPFEPRNKKKQKQDKQSSNVTNTKATAEQKKTDNKKSRQKSSKNREEASLSAIPDAVSKRMARRMAFFSGIPTVLGIASFFIFYWLFKLIISCTRQRKTTDTGFGILDNHVFKSM